MVRLTDDARRIRRTRVWTRAHALRRTQPRAYGRLRRFARDSPFAAAFGRNYTNAYRTVNSALFSVVLLRTVRGIRASVRAYAMAQFQIAAQGTTASLCRMTQHRFRRKCSWIYNS